MTLSQFHTYKEQAFDSYISKVIKNEGKDAKKEIARRAQHEVALSQLLQSELAQIATSDKYEIDNMTFSVIGGDTVIISDFLLGKAIAALPPQRREVILQSYFLNKNDVQIASLMHLETDTVNKRRHATLRRLKELLEALDYER